MTEGSGRPNGGPNQRPAYLDRPSFVSLLTVAAMRGISVSWTHTHLLVGSVEVEHAVVEANPDEAVVNLLRGLVREAVSRRRGPELGQSPPGWPSRLPAPWHEYVRDGTHITYKSG
jgi:hypothetical protein